MVPEGPCQAGRNDNTVRLFQGDLELCHDCEVYRFPYLAKEKTATKQSGPASRKTTEKSEHSQSEPTEIGSVSTTPVNTVVVNELLAHVSFHRNAVSQTAMTRSSSMC